MNKEPLWSMSIVPQLLWQIRELSEIGIVVRDLSVENVLIYYDLNYNPKNARYYKYDINGNEFYIKVQPIIFKIIDYDFYVIGVPIIHIQPYNHIFLKEKD